ncbi:MAG TPA: thioesterase family protein [Acidimicrobiales bacterium]|nr:thioesterase family protein [Acidimicrobiales bacterium]
MEQKSPDGGTTVAPFSSVSAVRRRGEGEFAADVHPEWTIAGKPNGGYLLATMARAAVELSAQGHVLAASAHYLSSPDPGPVDIEAEVLRTGRNASQLRARMRQGARPCVEALFTTGRLDAEPAYWDEGVPDAGAVAFHEGVALPGRTPSGDRVAIMDQVDIRLDPPSAAFASGAPRGTGELRGWLALRGDEVFDPFSLLFAADAFPPATFDIEHAGWVPTLELTAYVRALPAPGPVRILQKAHAIRGRRVDEACFVWDSSGSLVAQATQLAGIRLG